MSDITLSSAIRQNLLSLQNTSRDLTTTQEHLSTGKKVNTAFDNPTSYFTSQSLTNRANDLSALLDQIGQAQQTLNQANNGLTSLTSLLEQALSTAQQGQQAAPAAVTYSTVAGSVALADDTTQITSTNTVASLATSGVVASVQSNVDLKTAGLSALTAGDTINFTLGTTAVTATFGTTNAGNTFDNAAGLITVLNATTNFGTNGATALTDGAGGVTLYSNDLSTNFVTTFTSTGLTATNLVTTAHSLGDALTLSDGTHSSSFYYVAQNAQAADGTFNTNAQLASTISNATYSLVHSTITPTAIASGANTGDIQLAAANNTAITVGGNIGSALGFGTTAYENNYNTQLAGLANGDTLTVQVGSGTAHTLTFGTGSGQIATKTALTAALGAFTDVTAGFNSGNDVLFTPTSTSTITIGGTPAAAALFGLTLGATTPTATVNTPSATRTTLQGNYNALLTQIDQLAGDSSYNGVNLLTGDNLTVIYNEIGTSSQTIAGVNDKSGGLGLKALNNGEFQDNNQIGTVISNINAAIATVRAQTETFGSNSSTITIRQSFETNVINTLQTGSSNLVLADQNQESANLLTEQTQQQLEISALSIANQANQSVLKLFP